MAANDNSGKMSPELIRDLSRVLSEVDALMKKQEELLATVLKGEQNIAEVRIASLDVYFETYSKKLNDIAKQYKDDISGAFSILDKKLTEGNKTQSKKKAAKEGGETGGQTKQPAADTDTCNSSRAISEIRNLLKKGIDVNDRQQQLLLTNILDTLKNQPTSYVSSPFSNGTDAIGYTPNNEPTATNGQGQGATQQPVEPIQTPPPTKTGTTESADRKGIDITEKDVENEDIEKFFDEITAQYEKATRDRIAAKNKLIAAGMVEEETIVQASIDKQVADAYTAQKNALDSINDLKAAAAAKQDDEVLEAEANKISLESEARATGELAKRRAEAEAKEINKIKKKNGGKISPEELKKIQAKLDKEYEFSEKNIKRISKLQQRQDEQDQKEKEKQAKQKGDAAVENLLRPLDKYNSLVDRIGEFKNMRDNMVDSGKSKGAANFALAAKAATALLEKLEDQIVKVASYKGAIDTRLQGSKNDKGWTNSYWEQLTRDMMKVGAVTPYFKQEKFAENINSLVDRGIAFDLKQRAFLMTIQEKIATTFEVADGTLLRLIRIQQEDSTAGRLGMESALNSFLNEMYENTEYLKDVAANVRGSLMEMEALMEGAAATEVEYQVQKWMGSLYSVGMSSEAVNAISTALGQIAAGQIDALTGNGAGNLLVMAASNSGKSIADILESGLDATETNDLLQATVNYLAEIAKNSDSNVVQQQIASVFGVKASDLKAATNLAVSKKEEKSSIGDIYAKQLTYDNMLKQLNDMASTMYKRTSISEMTQNVWNNGQYTLASSMANNPVSYLLYKVASLMDATVGGIPIPSLTVVMNGVDLETTVTDIMRLGAVGGGILGSIGSMVSGLANSFSGTAMLKKMDIDVGKALEVVERGGEGSNLNNPNPGGGQQSTSTSGYVGNANDSDIKASTMQGAEDSKKQLMIEAKEKEPANQMDSINVNVTKIYELLEKVASGSQSLRVRVDNYGLTGTNNSTVVGTSQGGVASLTNDSISSSASGGSISNTGSNSNGGSSLGGTSNTSYSGVVDLGGWTMF